VPSGQAGGGLLVIIFTLGLQIPMYRYVKMTTRMSTASRDDLGWDKSPEIPSLSNGVNAASTLLVVVGGIAFISKRKAFLGS
jgi:hypothetical protein